MIYQHKSLASGRWVTFSFLEQMANIGSEVERALNWKDKNNAPYSQKAFIRALELIDLTLESVSNRARFREVSRVREVLVDFFVGSNQYGSTQNLWRSYFLPFARAARSHR